MIRVSALWYSFASYSCACFHGQGHLSVLGLELSPVFGYFVIFLTSPIKRETWLFDSLFVKVSNINVYAICLLYCKNVKKRNKWRLYGIAEAVAFELCLVRENVGFRSGKWYVKSQKILTWGCVWGCHTPKTEFFRDAYFVVTGGIGNCDDNLWCYGDDKVGIMITLCFQLLCQTQVPPVMKQFGIMTSLGLSV